MRQKAFNVAMWMITTAATVVILGGLVAALWDAITWSTYWRAGLTALIAWFLLAVPAGALLGRKPQRKKVLDPHEAWRN